MCIKRNIMIDGQGRRFLLRLPPLFPGSTGCGSAGISTKICGIWKRGLTRMPRRIPTWTCSPWKWLRTSPMSWQSMQIRPSRICRRNGWIVRHLLHLSGTASDYWRTVGPELRITRGISLRRLDLEIKANQKELLSADMDVWWKDEKNGHLKFNPRFIPRMWYNACR